MKTKKIIKVVELFAGVGGFRLGLEGWKGMSATSGYKKHIKSNFKIVFSNQFEPSTKVQHASNVYETRWGKDSHNGNDIANLSIDEIPDHDLLVGGFPCQDYSVATTLKNSKGLIGKKGVLWWSIHNILSSKKNPPKFLLLENVDRLLISPSNNRGRDFAIILKSLDDLGYGVEWRIINAAEFGFPQRRKRVFILAYHKSTKLYSIMSKAKPIDYLLEKGIIAQTFPIVIDPKKNALAFKKLNKNIVEISESYDGDGFENTGYMLNGVAYNCKTVANYEGERKVLKDVVITGKVPIEFYVDEKDQEKWEYLKGPKKEIRTDASGYEYNYTEGNMAYPDLLKNPSRTIITGEGGASPSRFKHIILTKYGLRRLTPIELERLNMFPDNHTLIDGVSDTKRAFFMGNALVVGVIECIGQTLQNYI